MRTPNKTVVLGAALLSLVATAAWGLGLGDLQVQSGLGQPFSATIPLRVDSPSELNGLTVGLADADAFRRAGVERSAAAESLHFAVDAKHVPPRIVVSSAKPVNEPFINFLVSARSSDGVLSREYTVLLNPASYGKQAAIASGAAPVSMVAANPVPPPPPRPAAPSPTPPPSPMRSVPAAGAAAPAAWPAARPAGTAVARGRFGPVHSGQTFWSIAEHVRPDPSITMDQVLLAIYTANPRAFSEGRFNGLMKGRVLEIPDAAEMRATPPAEAAARVRHLRAQVALARPPAVVSKPITPALAATEKPVAPAAQESPVAPAETAAERLAARVPATPAADAGLPASTADAAASHPQPAAEVAPSAAAAADVAEGTTPVATAPPVAPQAGGEGSAAVNAEPAASSSTTGADHAATPAAGQGSTAVAGDSAPSATASQHVTLKHAPAQTPSSTSSPSSLMDSFNLPLVGGAAIVILLLGWLGLRRRQASGHDVPAVMPAAVPSSGPHPAAPQIDMVEDSATEQAAAPKAPVQDAEALAAELEAVEDHKPAPSLPHAGGFEKVPEAVAAATGEGDDPVADAEFHLAYGLYDEAVPLLEKAVAQQPGNVDLQVKLAQTYAAAGKPEAFEALAESLHGRVSAAVWQGLAAQGRKLCPGVALFVASAAGAAPASGVDHAGLAAPVMEDQAADPAAVPPAQAGELPGVAADVALPEVAEAQTRQPADLPAAPGDNVIEFDPEPDHAAPAEAVMAPAATHGHDGDIEAMVAEGLAAADEAVQKAPAAGSDAGHSVDFNLEDFDIDIPAKTTPAAAGAAAAPANALDLGPIAFNLGDEPVPGADVAGNPDVTPPAAPPAEEGDVGSELPEHAIPEGADYSGKLDLAQIYASMGENDAAREVAREVLQHGDAELRTAAEKLLATLAG